MQEWDTHFVSWIVYQGWMTKTVLLKTNKMKVMAINGNAMRTLGKCLMELEIQGQ